jgi:hypothetical protein
MFAIPPFAIERKFVLLLTIFCLGCGLVAADGMSAERKDGLPARHAAFLSTRPVAPLHSAGAAAKSPSARHHRVAKTFLAAQAPGLAGGPCRQHRSPGRKASAARRALPTRGRSPPLA